MLTKAPSINENARSDLQEKMNLRKDATVPLFGVVSRLYWQKGLDLLVKTIPQILNHYQQAQFVILGSGDPELECSFKNLASKYPQRISTIIGFNEPLARQILLI